MAARIDTWWRDLGPHVEDHFIQVLTQASTRGWQNLAPMRTPFRADDIRRLIAYMARLSFAVKERILRRISLAQYGYDANPELAAARDRDELRRANALVIFWQRLDNDEYLRLQWILWLRSARAPLSMRRRWPGWFT